MPSELGRANRVSTRMSTARAVEGSAGVRLRHGLGRWGLAALTLSVLIVFACAFALGRASSSSTVHPAALKSSTDSGELVQVLAPVLPPTAAVPTSLATVPAIADLTVTPPRPSTVRRSSARRSPAPVVAAPVRPAEPVSPPAEPVKASTPPAPVPAQPPPSSSGGSGSGEPAGKSFSSSG